MGAAGAAATVTPAQFSSAFAVEGVAGGGNNEVITFSAASTSLNTVASTVEYFTLSGGASDNSSNAITVGANQTSITGAGGNDTVNVSSNAAAATVLATAVKLGGGTADTVAVTGNTATGTITLSANVTGVETISFANVDTAVVLVTDDGNMATGATTAMTVTAASLTTGTLNFNGSAETGAFGYTVTSTSTGADTLQGGAGNDVFNAGNGSNSFTGNGGKDSITGGTGTDIVYGDNDGVERVETYTVTTAGAGTATLTILGETVAATYATTGDALIAALHTAAQADPRYNILFTTSVTANAGTNTDDVLRVTYLVDGTNVGSATTSANTLAVNTTGTNGTAVGGTQVTAGTAGTNADDTIIGGAGVDTIVGGGGNDVLTGDAGADRFAFVKADSTLGNLATITDYRAAAGNNAGAADTIILGDVVSAVGTVTTVQDLSAQASLGAALNAAANSNTTAANGVVVFMYGGDTYVLVETTAATATFVATDFLVKITGTPFNTSTAIAGLGIDGL